ncbi:class I SAM-dependent DNA methyltransferase [Actinoplanes utahensis]|uniref:class I SAM-dependent DNA methyltransferase n=1 Tax=Actinoplanes utahensis TaxID=1869 RepID=UPI001F28CD0B|nr:class I SAM-dependent methyltransferase [Actinoplanes utahensis]
MPDPIFAHPRLAAVHDTFDGDRDDLDAYQEIIAELGARRILDLGCGTGSLAIRLAVSGLSVTGVDPAAASLDVARAKPGAHLVTWLAQMPRAQFDVAVMTGNVAQVFTTDDAWASVLADLHTALRPGGVLVFETRRPEYRIWDEWSIPVAQTRDVPGIGPVEQRFQLTDVRLPLVSFRYTYTFPDGEPHLRLHPALPRPQRARRRADGRRFPDRRRAPGPRPARAGAGLPVRETLISVRGQACGRHCQARPNARVFDNGSAYAW